MRVQCRFSPVGPVILSFLPTRVSLRYMRGVRAARLVVLLLFGLLAAAAPVRPAAARPPHLQRAALSWDGPAPTWRARMRRDDDAPVPNGRGLVDVSRWPAEPPELADIPVDALASALKDLCGSFMPSQRPGLYAAWILEHSAHFQVDPLVVAGLVIGRSACRPKHKSAEGIGLSQIHDKMHWGSLREGVYRYSVFAEGGWAERELDVGRFQFTRHMLAAAGANIYFTAALLRVAIDQCPHNDGAFGSVAHRRPVSHVIWGDRVRGTDGEDQVMRIRRMLIEHLTGARAALRGELRGQALVSPLDGAPRKITSAMGDERDGGRREHEGVDFASYIGEPVRAVADGVVRFAGVGGKNVKASAIRSVKGKPMGRAGIYIKVQHADDVVSAYMHLSDVVVSRGDEVRAGQLIGHVGRSGIQASSAHLHFELRHGGVRVDPMPALGEMVFDPGSTWRGLRIEHGRTRKRAEEKKARLQRKRQAKQATKP